MRKKSHIIKLFEKFTTLDKIDFTYLRPDATTQFIKEFCEKAKDQHYYAVCVRPEFVTDTRIFLEDSEIKIVAVIDFPDSIGGKIGSSKIKNKLKEIRECIINGVDEVDVAIDYKYYIDSDDIESVKEEMVKEIRDLMVICSSNGIILKIVLDVDDMNYDELRDLCEICVNSGCHFISTSSGYSRKQTNLTEKLEKVKYMRRILPDFVRIKACGGIRKLEEVNQFLKYADRIGTSEEV